MAGSRAMIRTSQPGWNEGAIALSASRSLRRTRFRTTAPPSLRPVESPKRVSSRSFRRIRTTSRRLDLTDPCPCKAAKSSGLESITSRGELWPRSAVRPLASCGRGRDVQTARGVPRVSSSGRGSRALLRDAAFWAGRSVSLDGEYLSIRPRGQDTPKGTRTRLAPVSALARLPADYRNDSLRVSNGPAPGGSARAAETASPADTPGEYTIRIVPKPCRGRWGGAILRRPAAPDNPRATARRDREDRQTAPEKSPDGHQSRRRKVKAERASVTIPAIHSSLPQD